MFSEAGTCDSRFANHIFFSPTEGTAISPSLPSGVNKKVNWRLQIQLKNLHNILFCRCIPEGFNVRFLAHCLCNLSEDFYMLLTASRNTNEQICGFAIKINTLRYLNKTDARVLNGFLREPLI